MCHLASPPLLNPDFRPGEMAQHVQVPVTRVPSWDPRGEGRADRPLRVPQRPHPTLSPPPLPYKEIYVISPLNSDVNAVFLVPLFLEGNFLYLRQHA